MSVEILPRTRQTRAVVVDFILKDCGGVDVVTLAVRRDGRRGIDDLDKV